VAQSPLGSCACSSRLAVSFPQCGECWIPVRLPPPRTPLRTDGSRCPTNRPQFTGFSAVQMRGVRSLPSVGSRYRRFSGPVSGLRKPVPGTALSCTPGIRPISQAVMFGARSLGSANSFLAPTRVATWIKPTPLGRRIAETSNANTPRQSPFDGRVLRLVLEDEGIMARDSTKSRPAILQGNHRVIPKNLQIRILARTKSAYGHSAFPIVHGRLISRAAPCSRTHAPCTGNCTDIMHAFGAPFIYKSHMNFGTSVI